MFHYAFLQLLCIQVKAVHVHTVKSYTASGGTAPIILSLGIT